jgi:hypothetical protein
MQLLATFAGSRAHSPERLQQVATCTPKHDPQLLLIVRRRAALPPATGADTCA